jgi:hypothetical protein
MNALALEYQQDFCEWLIHNAQLLRHGRLGEIDAENLAEELEYMSKSQQRELLSRLKILFSHLLKWQYQPSFRSGSWRATIVEQRQQIEEILETSPSLARQIETKLEKAYLSAVELASAETGIQESDFPSTCPQALDNTFYPEI